MLKAGEICDDGIAGDFEGCLDDCTGEYPGWHCSGGNQFNPSICLEQCNDGIITTSEDCEDGNVVNGDGCSASCLYEVGWDCTGAIPDVCTPRCGDGI